MSGAPQGEQRLVEGCPGELDLVAGTLDLDSGRADPFGQVVADGVEAGAVATGDNELWKGSGRQVGQGQVGIPATGGVASNRPTCNPTPKPRARVSRGERPVPTTGPARGAASPAAPSCSSLRRTTGSHTCDSRTCPASHPSPPSAGSPPSRRRRSRPTRSGRPQHVVSRGARGHTVRALARAAA
jgi:hypothetical protein